MSRADRVDFCDARRDFLERHGVDNGTAGIDFNRLFKRRYWGGYHIPRHFNLFSERALLALCSAAGLEHLGTRYTPQPIHWAWSVHHWLADRGAPEWVYRWLNLRNPAAMGIFTGVEVLAGVVTRRMSNMQFVARQFRD